MEIVKPLNHNFNFIGDASKDIADLPCRVANDPELGNTITSAWKPTEDELLKLLNGGNVELTLVGHGHPPVMLSVAPAQPDLFMSQPLHGVIGYAQQWEGICDATVNCGYHHTFDETLDAANDRYTPEGWRKVGEPFPVSKAIGYKSADRAMAELQAAVQRAGFDILRTDSEDGFPFTISVPGGGIGTHALAAEISDAVRNDELNGGCDLAAGMFGPAMSALIRKIATTYIAKATP